ncbi:hypothetical protein [Mesorhizobium sp. B2-3-4]|uniref:hypothetical protein n=1 Tax=Mesorhizobium sp. B2-3-4 TaxID=2589959 RepID=UPI00112CC03F|nr:hypothetical protein [Mesorhizobium sp. B2-3-4]TPM41428.1 hypothetical protein FJ967_00375 [Mesorhizobium sp. B2-3-4]
MSAWLDKALAAIATLVAAILPYLEKIGLVSAGAALNEGADARRALDRVGKADDAARAVDATDDDGMQHLLDKWS